MERDIAIVLKNYYPARTRITLLDQSVGHIDCWSDRYDLPVGTLIAYHQRVHIDRYSAQSIELMALPPCTCLPDLVFVHQVLEICYRFSPPHCAAPDLFALISILYQEDTFSRLHNSLLKKIFLCKIFVMLGVWPLGEKFQSPFFYRLATESIDNLLEQPIQLKYEHDLEGWVHGCIAMHPRASDFKAWKV